MAQKLKFDNTDKTKQTASKLTEETKAKEQESKEQEAKQTEEKKPEAEKEDKPKKPNRTKNRGDYLNVDLKPKGGSDLKAHVVKRSAELSMKEGRKISSTEYIQSVLEMDLRRNSGKAIQKRRNHIEDMLYKLSDDDVKALEQIIQTMLGESKA